MKWIMYVLLFVLALVLGALALLRFAPSTLLSAVNSMQGAARIEASNLNTALFAPALATSALDIEVAGYHIQAQELSLSSSFTAWRNKHKIRLSLLLSFFLSVYTTTHRQKKKKDITSTCPLTAA